MSRRPASRTAGGVPSAAPDCGRAAHFVLLGGGWPVGWSVGMVCVNGLCGGCLVDWCGWFVVRRPTLSAPLPKVRVVAVTRREAWRNWRMA
eukprot:41529-Chlamydomonas_euryale.AAC.2